MRVGGARAGAGRDLRQARQCQRGASELAHLLGAVLRAAVQPARGDQLRQRRPARATVGTAAAYAALR